MIESLYSHASSICSSHYCICNAGFWYAKKTYMRASYFMQIWSHLLKKSLMKISFFVECGCCVEKGGLSTTDKYCKVTWNFSNIGKHPKLRKIYFYYKLSTIANNFHDFCLIFVKMYFIGKDRRKNCKLI